jgi:hypothetical protein
MRFSNLLTARMLWIATAGIAALLCFAPCSKAQEVAPDHFTDTGVDDVWSTGAMIKQSATLKRTAPSARQASRQEGQVRSLNQVRKRARRRANHAAD